jgi:hypothetical protein
MKSKFATTMDAALSDCDIGGMVSKVPHGIGARHGSRRHHSHHDARHESIPLGSLKDQNILII